MSGGFSGLDGAFLVWFLAVSLGVGLAYARRGGRDLGEYFLAGRKLPGWAIGTSMVATTFAADTPLVVTGFVLSGGIAKNWLWWSMLVGGTLTACVFARWWRRAEITTEIELVAIRYDGRPARALRAIKAVFLGLVLSSIAFGWVTKAMGQVLETVFAVDRTISLAILVALTLAYAAVSGLWGVVATDVIQFAMAMVGAILLAALAVAEVGGLGPLVARIEALGAERGRDLLALAPTSLDALAGSVAILALVNWWAVYYPGAEPGGGGFVAQRMLAASDERSARSGTVWFLFAHYALRPWPWILTALAAAALEPRFLDGVAGFETERAYPWMFRVLPPGMLGLVVASFFAAYMSTITTLLNLAASYLVQDLWLPLAPKSSRRAQVALARGTVVFVCAAGCLVAWSLRTAGAGWEAIMELTAGSGLVLILRWVWWRVNAWSEIAAMGASALGYAIATRAPVAAWFLELGGGDRDLARDLRLVAIVGFSCAASLSITWLTRPASPEVLAAFYRRVRPGGLWGPVARAAGLPQVPLRREALMWAASTVSVLGALLGIGWALLGRPVAATLALGSAAAGGLLLRRLFALDREGSASHREGSASDREGSAGGDREGSPRGGSGSAASAEVLRTEVSL